MDFSRVLSMWETPTCKEFKPMSKLSYRKPLEEIIRRGRNHSDVFTTFVRLAAIALERSPFMPEAPREAEYMETIERVKDWHDQAPSLFANALAELVTEMETEPFTDLLGETYIEWGSRSGQVARGEFYTPQSVSRAVAKMVLPQSPDEFYQDRPVSILEPACGAGSMILAAGWCVHELGVPVQCIRVQGWDIAPVAIDMCMINTTLWAIPFEGVLGNPLSMEVRGSFRNPWFHMAHGYHRGTLTPKPDPEHQTTVESVLKPNPGALVLQASLFEDSP